MFGGSTKSYVSKGKDGDYIISNEEIVKEGYRVLMDMNQEEIEEAMEGKAAYQIKQDAFTFRKQLEEGNQEKFGSLNGQIQDIAKIQKLKADEDIAYKESQDKAITAFVKEIKDFEGVEIGSDITGEFERIMKSPTWFKELFLKAGDNGEVALNFQEIFNLYVRKNYDIIDSVNDKIKAKGQEGIVDSLTSFTPEGEKVVTQIKTYGSEREKMEAKAAENIKKRTMGIPLTVSF